MGLLAKHNNGTRRIGNTVLTSRANQHSYKFPVASTANHKEFRTNRLFDEYWRRMALDDFPLHDNLRVSDLKCCN